MARRWNFCAGPAALPEEVIWQIKNELPEWQNQGTSIVEISHRSPAVVALFNEAETLLRELLDISNEYAVLFLQGGATTQFSMIPLNLKERLSVDKQQQPSAAYVNTGLWSQKAILEGSKQIAIKTVASSENTNFTTIPSQDSWQIDKSFCYLHYTVNETINGVEFHWIPELDDIPLVADVSSTILSRPLDVSRFGLLYAGAQKNLGPAGLTLVIVRKDLLSYAVPNIPGVFHYATQVQDNSMYNTPAVFACYVACLVLRWLKKKGGLKVMADDNLRKANLLYQCIDNSSLYENHIEVASRSLMNIPFLLANKELEKFFLNEAEKNGLLHLKGHRKLGGCRASIYNAIPIEAVTTLVDFMQEFERSQA